MASILLLLGIAWMPLSAESPDWQEVVNGRLPEVPTIVGYSADGNPLFLLRSERSGITNLGWYDSGTATLIGVDRAAPARAGEVYTGAGRWVASRAGSLPNSFISAGNDANGRPMYILRVSSGGWLVPAIYSADDNAAVAFIGGKRLLFSTFETLVPDWAMAGDSFGQAFRGGTDSDGSILVPFRAQQGGGLQPGKFNTGTRQGYISYGGRELTVRDPTAEVFVGQASGPRQMAAFHAARSPRATTPTEARCT